MGIFYLKGSVTGVQFTLMVGGLEHEFYDFPHVGKNTSNSRAYFSEGLKSPTSNYMGLSRFDLRIEKRWRMTNQQ